MTSRFRNFLLLFLVFYSSHCFSQSQAGTSTKTKVIDRMVSCHANQEHTYQIFVPSVEKSKKKMPLLVVIDPHGNGKLAVAGFRDAAQKYQIMVVGSNLIRNNDDKYIREIDELIADVKDRYPVGNAIFLGGFSGGARMSIGYATNHPIEGVIACGALAPPQQISFLNCRIMSVIGLNDFNFTEAAPFVLDPSQMPSNLSVEITKDSHSWPEKGLLRQATGYLLFASSSDYVKDKQSEIREYVDEQMHRIDSLKKANENIRAALIARNMSIPGAFEKGSSFRTLFSQLMQNENYRLQIDRLSKCIKLEIKTKGIYSDAFFQKDSVWWRKEINMLNTEIASEKDEFMHFTYLRIRGFLGIMCYSLCQRFAGDKDARKLNQILSVYRLVEPGNPEVMHFTRILDQWKRSK